MEKEIINLVREKGPLTGSEVRDITGYDGLSLWRTCMSSESLMTKTVGTRYLRLDRRVKGLARLSPSILREFLTYSVISHPEDYDTMEQRVRKLRAHIEEVSKSKLELAYQLVSSLTIEIGTGIRPDHEFCFIIAGDIVHNMAHDVPRPERSTGKLVNGSDMDIVVVVDDLCPDSTMRQLDNAIYKEKHRLLIAPHIREEIDYVVKRMKRVREQVCFDTFRHKVACKILQEGTLLYGSEEMFHAVKTMLRDEAVTERLEGLEHRARTFRSDGERHLLLADPNRIEQESLHLFYPQEESEEFE